MVIPPIVRLDVALTERYGLGDFFPLVEEYLKTAFPRVNLPERDSDALMALISGVQRTRYTWHVCESQRGD
jgi:hypothetical protein